uniref:Ribosomal protein S1 n=1 Tax=Jakoba bahamiensis TaxID=221721 RepID=M4QL39_9EUKA|nr:ribosomal protein S1 [Jakoba bahamiensis]AGH24168.1 ribosomal protein S1 [Jakoba bahamiensis]
MSFISKIDNFSDQLKQSAFFKSELSDCFLEGPVISNSTGVISVDLGLKVPAKFRENELKSSILYSSDDGLDVGKKVRVSMWTIETSEGDLLCDPYSYEQSLHDSITWNYISKQEFVKGIVVNSVNGGFSVAIGGIIAFLPRSLAKLPRVGKVEHIHSLMTTYSLYKVITVNESTKNIVLGLWRVNTRM